MSMFRLVQYVDATDLECPACNTKADVCWQTEYGESIYGKHDVECPSCGYEFVMDVYDEVVYHSRLKEPKNDKQI